MQALKVFSFNFKFCIFASGASACTKVEPFGELAPVPGEGQEPFDTGNDNYIAKYHLYTTS